MPQIPCPEKTCGQAKVSTTAAICPSCGCDIQKFLRDDLTRSAVGFALAPLDAWQSHFWYYTGCRGTYIDVVAEGWINVHDPLMTLRYRALDGKETTICVIRSPTDGLVVRSRVVLRTMPNIGYAYAPPPTSQEFIVVRPWRHHVHVLGEPSEQVHWCNSYSFAPLIEAIYQAVAGQNFFSRLFNALFPDRAFRKLDPKQFFETKVDLLKTADALQYTHAIWLPEWNFTSDA